MRTVRKLALLLVGFIAFMFLIGVAYSAPPKFIDEPNSYLIKLGEGNYLTFNAPKRVFQVGKNEVDGHPAVRQGWGLGFIVSPHPTARGADAMIYIEVLGEATGKLSDFAKEYAATEKLKDLLLVRAMALDGEPLKPTKAPFKMGKKTVESWHIAYNCHPTNATVTPNPGVGKAWIFDIEKVRVIVSCEAMKERYDASNLLDGAFSWSKVPPKANGGSVFKMLDTTMFVYRFMHMKLPANLTPVYDGEMGVAAAWEVFNAKGDKVGILRFSGTFIKDQELKDHLATDQGYEKVGVGGATFFEKRAEFKTVAFAKDSAGMAWKWVMETLPTTDASAHLVGIEEKNDQAKETAKRQYKAVMEGLDAENYLLLHNVLGTVFTWAVKN